MRHVLVLLAILSLTACGSESCRVSSSTTSSTTGGLPLQTGNSVKPEDVLDLPENLVVPIEVKDIKELKKLKDEARAKVEAAKLVIVTNEQTIKSLDARIREAELERVRTILTWIGFISILGVAASIALYIWLPIGKRIAVGLGVAFASLAAASFLFVEYLAYLKWFGPVLAVVGVGYAIIYILKLKKSAQLSAAYGDAMEKAETAEDVLKVKAEAVADQAKAKVRDVIAKLRGKQTK